MDLGFYCLGHGITVADRSRTENGDYKQIAFIRPSGVINYQEAPERIPAEALEQIRQQAEGAKVQFMGQWEKLPVMKQYEIILDSLTPAELVSLERGTPAQETIKRFFPAYLERC